MEINNFNGLGLSEESLRSIKMKGFEEPTEIQRRMIPLILKNDIDLIGQAQTGTGKTAAFALPLIDSIQPHAGHLQAVILVPTRELAVQVAEEFNSLKGHKNIHIAPIYGGQSYETQFRILKKGVDIIVGTPGRVIDHLNRKSLLFNNVSFVILDEADEMLNMGFIDDIEEILSKTNPARRTLLFSATMPDRILKLAKKYMHEHKIIRAEKAGQTTDLTDQIYFEVRESDKFDSLCRIIDTTIEFYGLVFCRTKNDVDTITRNLVNRGYDAEGLHGDISQGQREKVLNKFKMRKINVLVATDVAARGLDIYDLTHVINYSLPQDPESYLHRIGRTGRAGKEGKAITFVNSEEHRKLTFIKNITKTEIRKERIPHVKDVIKFKKERILFELNSIIEAGLTDTHISLAEELIKDRIPEEVVASLISYAFKDTLDEDSYAHIHDLFESTNKKKEKSGTKKKNRTKEEKGYVRMFIALGKKDNIGPKQLLKLINNKTGVENDKVQGIQIMDSYSFFNVPTSSSDLILSSLNSKNKKERALVEIAKPSKKS